MKAAMSGITVTDKNVKAEDYKPETTNPDTPSGGDETTGETWTVSVDKCSDFFNDAVTAGKVKTEPKLEVKETFMTMSTMPAVHHILDMNRALHSLTAMLQDLKNL